MARAERKQANKKAVAKNTATATGKNSRRNQNFKNNRSKQTNKNTKRTPKKMSAKSKMTKAKKTPSKKTVVNKKQKSLIARLIAALKSLMSEKLKTAKGKKIPNGRTLKTKDEYLPYDPKQVEELKNKRWVAVIDSNKDNELAIVRLTDENKPNTTLLPNYKKGNKKDTYFKHFVETTDNNGDPIKVIKGGKFQENDKRYDLKQNEIEKIRKKVLEHSTQCSENKKKLTDLKEKNKR